MHEEKRSLTWLRDTTLVALFWGHYGVFAKLASLYYHHQSQLPYWWVCLVYGIPGTLICLALIKLTNDRDKFPLWSIIWGIVAGVAGAGGALCVLLAFRFEGHPVVVMSLVFGVAQVFNPLWTRVVAGKFRFFPNWLWWAMLPAVGVLSFMVQSLKTGSLILSFALGLWFAFTISTAAQWGLYGVGVRKSNMASKKATGGNAHGSHWKVVLVVCLTYFSFFFINYFLGMTGVWKQPITLELLFADNSAIGCSLLLGAVALLGTIFVVPANSGAGSPGPLVVMPLVFLGAACVNVLATPIWEYFLHPKHPPIQYSPALIVCVILLAAAGYLLSMNNPNRTDKALWR